MSILNPLSVAHSLSHTTSTAMHSLERAAEDSLGLVGKTTSAAMGSLGTAAGDTLGLVDKTTSSAMGSLGSAANKGSELIGRAASDIGTGLASMTEAPAAPPPPPLPLELCATLEGTRCVHNDNGPSVLKFGSAHGHLTAAFE
eukprot:7389697-Prymnesium_polylepis.1